MTRPMNLSSMLPTARTAAAILTIACAGLLSGCTCCGTGSNTGQSASTNLSASDRAEAGRVLARLDDAWSAAAATRDAAKVGSFYADDAIAYPPNEPMVAGKANAQKVWAAYFADPSFEISWKSDRAEVAASGELGYTSGAYKASSKGPDGKMLTENGKFLCIWRKQADGSWRAVHDMWNTDAK